MVVIPPTCRTYINAGPEPVHFPHLIRTGTLIPDFAFIYQVFENSESIPPEQVFLILMKKYVNEVEKELGLDAGIVALLGDPKLGSSSICLNTDKGFPQLPSAGVELKLTKKLLNDGLVKFVIIGAQHNVDGVTDLVTVLLGVTDGVCVLLGVGVKLAVAVGVEAELYPTPSISQSTQFGICVLVGVTVGVGVPVGV